MYTYQTLGFKKFGSDDRGAVAITFGVMAMALFFMAGVAIDYSRVMNVRGRLVEAADAAVLAAGKALLAGQSESDIQQLALTYFNENVKAITESVAISKPTISIDTTTGAVNLDVKATVDMTLTGLGGFPTQDVDVVSEAVFSTRDIEIGMALDITGSMGNRPSAGGETKISSLKKAFEKFTTRLIPEDRNGSQQVRIALAPYSASVNMGEFYKDVTDPKITKTDTCVSERKNGGATDETGVFFVKSTGKNDIDPEEGLQSNAFACPSPVVVPLSDDRDELIRKVNAFQPSGWTAGHLGVQWAWNLISDNWSLGGTTASSYDDVTKGKLLKAVVLMTDGSFNTAYHGDQSSKQAIALCNAMKAPGKDVVVFAVAFDAPANAQKTLRACATQGAGYYANASNAEELDKAFENFAGKLTELRLSK